jgi:hypothetical protein
MYKNLKLKRNETPKEEKNQEFNRIIKEYENTDQNKTPIKLDQTMENMLNK